MPKKQPTPEAVAAAWHGIEHYYGVRRNKAIEDGKQWEVFRTVESQPIDETNPVVVARYDNQDSAETRMRREDDRDRALAVLALF